MLIAIAPFVVMIVGLLLWALYDSPAAKDAPAKNTLVRDAARGAFFIGLFVALGVMAKTTVSIGGSFVAVVPFFVMIAGILFWALASRAIIKDIGKWSFFIGLYYVVSALARHTVNIG